MPMNTSSIFAKFSRSGSIVSASYGLVAFVFGGLWCLLASSRVDDLRMTIAQADAVMEGVESLPFKMWSLETVADLIKSEFVDFGANFLLHMWEVPFVLGGLTATFFLFEAFTTHDR